MITYKIINLNNDKVIPETVADRVAAEAIILAKIFNNSDITIIESYIQALRPYAEKVYTLEQLVKKLQDEKTEMHNACIMAIEQIKLLSDALHTANDLLEGANNTIKSLLK